MNGMSDSHSDQHSLVSEGLRALQSIVTQKKKSRMLFNFSPLFWNPKELHAFIPEVHSPMCLKDAT